MSEHHDHGHSHPADSHPADTQHSASDSRSDAEEALLDDLLDLEGEVLSGYWAEALAWVRQASDGTVRHRLLDLGAGTGTGTIGLAQRFGAAEVIAVDMSAHSLRRLRSKALDLGLAQRVHTVEVDLDTGWPDLGMLDLTWASMSLHHMADPARTLRDIHAATTPGGIIAVAEFSQPLRFLPDDLGIGRPGFEDRVVTMLTQAHAETLPTLGSLWAPRLADSGWHITDEREFTIDLRAPLPTSAVRYAHGWYTRLAQGVAERLDADDRGTLAALVGDGPDALPHRTELHIRGTRTITLARR